MGAYSFSVSLNLDETGATIILSPGPSSGGYSGGTLDFFLFWVDNQPLYRGTFRGDPSIALIIIDHYRWRCNSEGSKPLKSETAEAAVQNRNINENHMDGNVCSGRSEIWLEHIGQNDQF